MAQEKIQTKKKVAPLDTENLTYFNTSASKKQCQRLIDLVALGSTEAKKELESLRTQMKTSGWVAFRGDDLAVIRSLLDNHLKVGKPEPRPNHHRTLLAAAYKSTD